jgi:hypothetical protein
MFIHKNRFIQYLQDTALGSQIPGGAGAIIYPLAPITVLRGDNRNTASCPLKKKNQKIFKDNQPIFNFRLFYFLCQRNLTQPPFYKLHLSVRTCVPVSKPPKSLVPVPVQTKVKQHQYIAVQDFTHLGKHTFIWEGGRQGESKI